jgi:phospholipase C
LSAAIAPPAKTPIQHVVIVVQENRSFNNFFAKFPGAVYKTTGIPTKDHGTVDLQEVALVPDGQPSPVCHHSDIAHGWGQFWTSYDNGKMDGFDRVTYNNLKCQPVKGGLYPLQYVYPRTIQPYWDMAKQYVLADHMFQTQGSGSFTAHQDLIRGSTAINDNESVVDNPSGAPWGCNAPAGTFTNLLTRNLVYETGKGPFPCFKWKTISDLLDAKGVSWKYYAPVAADEGNVFWNAFNAIDAVYNGPEAQTNISIPQTNVLTDASQGRLPAVSWVVPDHSDSDHLGNATDSGPSWVASIVNAIGQSQYWNSTLIVVVWDDWGGLYDPVAPPQFTGAQPDYRGLGFRVPCIVVSPYAPKGRVAHAQFEFGSILKFVEQNWSLGSLHTTDDRSTSIGSVLNFKQTRRSFAPISTKYSPSYFLTRKPSGEPVDTE